jgi:predicted nucleotidyltransferase
MPHIFSTDEIRAKVEPIAQEYGVERVMLFGSYARGEATEESDIDLHIDEGRIHGYIQLSGFHLALEDHFGIPVDVLTTGGLDEEFLQDIAKEEILLYEGKTE